MKNFSEQALARARQRMNLIAKTKGNPTVAEQELQAFDQESATMADAMLDYDLAGKEVEVPGRDPSKYKGKTIRSKDGTQRLYSDGTRWIIRP